MNRESGAGKRVIRALRRVNLQGNVFGQTVAIRLGLSELDVEALEVLLDMGSATAGRLAELMGMSTGAVTRVVDRLEQAGYVRRSPDPADRRRVMVEVITDKVGRVQTLLGRMDAASAAEIARYSEDELDLIGDFLSRMADVAGREASSLRDASDSQASPGDGPAEHFAPLAGMKTARLLFRSGAESLELGPGAPATALYLARFEGAVPRVRVRLSTVTIQYHGTSMPWDWRKRKAALDLNTAARWDLDIVGGIHHFTANLAGLDVASLSLTGGTDRVSISLGRPKGEVRVKLVGGTNEARFDRPADVPVTLKVAGGTGGVTFDGRTLRRSAMTSVELTDAAKARDRFAIEIVGGSTRIEVGLRRDG